jgi:hypothetical protein
MTLDDAEEIVLLDTEFIAPPGERQQVVCSVALELRSGRLIREWLESERVPTPPFANGSGVVVVAYYASAEWGSHLALGRPLPELTIDLYPEFRIATNGKVVDGGSGLLGAQRWFGLGAMGTAEKERMRKRILAGGPYSAVERGAILDYCESDVRALEQLLPHLIGPRQDLLPALWRGRYMQVVAEMEWRGIPIDAELYRRMVEHWPELQACAIDRVNQTFPVYEGCHFRMARFEACLKARSLIDRWPRTADGCLALDEDTFRDQAALHPELEPLRQTRQMLGQLKRPGLEVGADGRNRCMLSAFRTVTGRNAPSTTKFIFGCPAWMRGLIRPEPGTALAYVDWSQQEFGIAAALSGDSAMQQAYVSEDCYLAFAKLAGAAPADATKATHPQVRRLFKSTVLGTQYQIGANGLACQVEITLPEAQDLLDHHRRVFSRFWEWSEKVCDYAQLYGELVAAFGWRIRLDTHTRLRTLANFPIQSNASEMLRLAIVYAAADGVRLLAPVHDAVVVEAQAAEIDDAVYTTQQAMRRASEAVLGGFSLRSDAVVIRYPERFNDERGRDMWSWIEQALATL